ncbi:MAG TPA: ribosome small subunit-dependent GTPase A [Longimicrobiales bacterium]|nr:ribosome small subunit-dependent GTPase A [Longimicrobiales bacterium]
MISPETVGGTVVETGGGVYRVRLDSGGQVDAALRGRLKLERRSGDKVVVGDRVRVARSGEDWVVEGVDPRSSQLLRRGPGGRKAKVVAANLDAILVVVAARDPDPTPSLIDRLLVVAETSGLTPVLVVNKADLPGGRESAQALRRLYGGIGYRVLVVSAVSGLGMEALAEQVCTGATALVGPSGAGKSSLLNALDPGLGLRIGDLSRRTGRGRHTTVSARLIQLSCGGAVADTPGFGDVGLWGVAPDEVAACFPEMEARVGECRFRGCAHLGEPGCAVRLAVERGEIAPSRYASYRTLRSEA